MAVGKTGCVFAARSVPLRLKMVFCAAQKRGAPFFPSADPPATGGGDERHGHASTGVNLCGVPE